MEEWLLCDFHIHTEMSDGSLSLRDVVDLYGSHGFDVIAITDHVFDPTYLSKLRERGTKVPSVTEENFKDYMKVLKEEQKRAWNEYRMLLIPGFEVTNNTDLYHIVVLDVYEYIDPSLSVEEILKIVRENDGISIAAHPEKKNTDREHLSKHLYENMDYYKELFDAWEIANQYDLQNTVGLKGCRFVANSDFHHIKHFFAWRTLLKTEKDPEAIKEAIKKNEEVAILFFKPGMNIKKVKFEAHALAHV
ncbi:PHP domain-containing protein [Aquifex aeolicus]|uniref:Polymerase/histidinol phosphatase N-terminal domain-containing protein n=1 Tax=Aquifex aeolicus (strain VF5) TaxID=224324 RepID=O67277_AQUAE|nr:PHP domain-containing protein [Aquifex aeolicus]AAC07237.1 putative protein [Aquifex aeolicus VF5]